DHPLAEDILRPCCARWNLHSWFAYDSPFASGAFFPDPPNLAPGRCFHAAFGAIFRFQPVLENIELQGPDRAEERYLDESVRLIEGLHDAFLEQLRQSVAKALEMRWRVVVQIREILRRESRHFAEHDAGLFGKRVADEEIVVADDAHDVAGKRFIHSLAFPGEQAL